MQNKNFRKQLLLLPNNSYYVMYKNKKYLLTKQTLLEGKLIKVYAQCLSMCDIVSGNYYPSIKEGLLKPCEMSDEKVIHFIINLEVLS